GRGARPPLQPPRQGRLSRLRHRQARPPRYYGLNPARWGRIIIGRPVGAVGDSSIPARARRAAAPTAIPHACVAALAARQHRAPRADGTLSPPRPPLFSIVLRSSQGMVTQSSVARSI